MCQQKDIFGYLFGNPLFLGFILVHSVFIILIYIAFNYSYTFGVFYYVHIYIYIFNNRVDPY